MVADEEEHTMVDRLDAALEALVADGVLDTSQAAAVRAAVDRQEELAAPPLDELLADAGSTTASKTSGNTTAAEIAAWVGAVLAGAAGITAATSFWAQLQVWAQSALLGLVAFVLLAAGEAVLGDHRGAARRVTGLTWLLGTFAAAAAVWVPLEELSSRNEGPLPLLIAALVGTALAVVLWRRMNGALQLIAIMAGVTAAAISGMSLPDRSPDDLYGIVVWAIGVAMLLLAWAGVALPQRTALTLGALAALIGAQMLHFSYPRLGSLWAIVTVAALFWLGGLLSQVALTGLSAAALAIFVPQGLDAFFPGSLNASATLFLAGILVLAGALVTLRAARPVEEHH